MTHFKWILILKWGKYLATYKSLQIMYLNFRKGTYIDFSSMYAQKVITFWTPSAVIQLC